MNWPRVMATALAVSALGLAACRAHSIWIGVAFDEEGRIKVAAEEPHCGCVTFASRASQPVTLRATFHGSTVGRAVLGPGERLRVRFDWAGSEDSDFYLVDGTVDGRPIRLSTDVRIEEPDGSRPCNATSCAYGDLKMDLGGR